MRRASSGATTSWLSECVHILTGEVRPDLLEDLLDVLIIESEALPRKNRRQITSAHWSLLRAGSTMAAGVRRLRQGDARAGAERAVSVSMTCSTSMISGIRSLRRRSMPILIVVVLWPPTGSRASEDRHDGPSHDARDDAAVRECGWCERGGPAGAGAARSDQLQLDDEPVNFRKLDVPAVGHQVRADL